MRPQSGIRLFALAAVACAALVSASLVAPAWADDDSEDDASLDDIPHVTMVGHAHIEARPDLATITIGVTTEQASAKAAAAEVAGKAKAVIDAAKAAGVPDIDIATQTVTLTQTFDPIKDGRGNEIGRKPRGFSADNTVAIKVRDLEKAGALAQDLIGRGANRFDGVEFSVEHPEPILDKLVGTAVKNARAQAEIATEAAGVRLGRVLVIERPGEAEGGLHRPFYRRKMAAAPAAMPLEAGTTSFAASVEITWAIAPR